MAVPATLYEKIWDDHVIERLEDGTCLLAVDRQLIYDATSRPAFAHLQEMGRAVRRPMASLAMADHMVPTRGRDQMRPGTIRLLEEFALDCATPGIPLLPLDDSRHGIVHVVGPEQGFTLPGLLMACADSHTSSHGALGALAFGVGSTELAHVLATQTIWQRPSAPMRVVLDGTLSDQVVAKDAALAVLSEIGAAGGAGHAIEFSGPVIDDLDVEGRLTLCNMAIEAGSRCGLIAPDETTFGWLEGRPMAPTGGLWDQAVAYWRTLRSDPAATFAREVRLHLDGLAPQVSWGTSPGQIAPIDGVVPDPAAAPNPETAASWQRALDYMDLRPGTPMVEVPVDRVFIGSCTNARLADLRAAARVVRGRHLAPSVTGMVVPGSGMVKAAAEAEGLDDIFTRAGFEWRDAGCSMCFGSRNDYVTPQQRCASTSNRNFENRQGPGARTHLVSPAMAAAAGIAGHFVDIRDMS